MEGQGLPGLSRWVTFLASAQVHLPGSSVNPILLVFYWGFLEVYFRQDWLAHWPLVVQLFPVQSHFFLDMGGCGWKCQPFNQVFGFSDKQMNSLKVRCSWKGPVIIIKRYFFTLRAPKGFRSSVPATSCRPKTYSKSQHHSLQGSSMLQHLSEFPSFLRLSNISLYAYTTLCLFIPEIFLWLRLFSSYIFIWALCMGKMSEAIHFLLVLIPAY